MLASKLILEKTKILGDGWGFVFRTLKDNLLVLSTNKELSDSFDGSFKRKIGVSLSTGCGVGCIYCFTNGLSFFRPLSVEEIVEQVDNVLRVIPEEEVFDEIKVSFKQMGDPLLNPDNTIEAIRLLHQKFQNFSFVVSTSAPNINRYFFDKLQQLQDLGLDIRLQYSCHTTSDAERQSLSPKLPMMTLEEISQVANNWRGNLVTLNFVLFKGFSYSVSELRKLFDPSKVFIKVNYLDDNCQLRKNNLSDLDKADVKEFVQSLSDVGFNFSFRNNQNVLIEGR